MTAWCPRRRRPCRCSTRVFVLGDGVMGRRSGGRGQAGVSGGAPGSAGRRRQGADAGRSAGNETGCARRVTAVIEGNGLVDDAHLRIMLTRGVAARALPGSAAGGGRADAGNHSRASPGHRCGTDPAASNCLRCMCAVVRRMCRIRV